MFHRWEGTKRSVFLHFFRPILKKGTPKGSLVTPLLGLLITHIIFTHKINGPLISQIWEPQGIGTVSLTPCQITGFLKQ